MAVNKYKVLNSTAIHTTDGIDIEIKEALDGTHDVVLSDSSLEGYTMRIGVPLESGNTHFIFWEDVIKACREMLLNREVNHGT